MEIRISEELNRIIGYAREEAMRTGNYGISPDHLFLAIIRHRDNAAAEVLSGLGVDLEEMKRSIDERLWTNEPIPYSDAESITFSRGAHNVLSMTVLEATRQMSGVATPEHLLLALCHYAGSGFGQTWKKSECSIPRNIPGKGRRMRQREMPTARMKKNAPLLKISDTT